MGSVMHALDAWTALQLTVLDRNLDDPYITTLYGASKRVHQLLRGADSRRRVHVAVQGARCIRGAASDV